MDAINTLRAILVGGAVIAAVVASRSGWWVTVLVLGAGIAAHALLWVHLHRGQPTSSEGPPEA